ncbi:Uma2 family endonuclease [Kutzneria sp. NPDC052558]|uniref:Uma2 family endonuclease n=1 Tax=Kutzneria sp. NPDC052558 TaxID=3364121 RepID=UPI0037C9044B
MTTAPPRSGDPISTAAFDELRMPDPCRLEIEDGRLLVTDWPAGPHLIARQRLAICLVDQLPVEFEALPAFEADLAEPSSRRVPDVVVCTEEASEQARVRADQILLAVEVVSPGESAARGYIKKPAEYAANGIPTTG